MSIQFEDAFNDEAREFIRSMMEAKEIPELVAKDEKTLLVNGAAAIKVSDMSELARKARQPVTVELNGIGEIKELSDGTRYEVTHKGWRKVVEVLLG